MNLLPMHSRKYLSKIIAFGLLSGITACGSSSDDHGSDDPLATLVYDSASYYGYFNGCEGTPSLTRKNSYNAKGVLIGDIVCATDQTKKLTTITERRLDSDTLIFDSYSELTLNDAGKIIAVNQWGNPEKIDLHSEYTFTYDDAGKLTQSTHKSSYSESLVTTDYDGKEVPSKEVEVSTKDGVTSTTTSTCTRSLFDDEVPCEKRKDDTLIESITAEGEELVHKEIVNGELIEVRRFSFLTSNLKKSDITKRYSFAGKLITTTTKLCNLDGDTASCNETVKTESGKTVATSTSTYKNFGTLLLKVGTKESTYPLFFETEGNFMTMDSAKEISGTMNATFDPATFAGVTAVSMELKPSSDGDLNDIDLETPSWNEPFSNLQDIFPDTSTSGKVQFNTVNSYTDKHQVLSEITGLTGLTLDEVDPMLVFKEEYIY